MEGASNITMCDNIIGSTNITAGAGTQVHNYKSTVLDHVSYLTCLVSLKECTLWLVFITFVILLYLCGNLNTTKVSFVVNNADIHADKVFQNKESPTKKCRNFTTEECKQTSNIDNYIAMNHNTINNWILKTEKDVNIYKNVQYIERHIRHSNKPSIIIAIEMSIDMIMYILYKIKNTEDNTSIVEHSDKEKMYTADTMIFINSTSKRNKISLYKNRIDNLHISTKGEAIIYESARLILNYITHTNYIVQN